MKRQKKLTDGEENQRNNQEKLQEEIKDLRNRLAAITEAIQPFQKSNSDNSSFPANAITRPSLTNTRQPTAFSAAHKTTPLIVTLPPSTTHTNPPQMHMFQRTDQQGIFVFSSEKLPANLLPAKPGTSQPVVRPVPVLAQTPPTETLQEWAQQLNLRTVASNIPNNGLPVPDQNGQ